MNEIVSIVGQLGLVVAVVVALAWALGAWEAPGHAAREEAERLFREMEAKEDQEQ